MADLRQALNSGSLMTSFDLVKRQDIPTLYRTRGYQRMPFFAELHTLGMSSGQDQDIFYHHEDTYFKQPIKVGATFTAGSAGANAVITLDASMVDNGSTFVRVNDVVLFAGNITGQVVAVTIATPSITVKPIVATQAIPSMATGDYFSITGNGKSRASGQPAGLVPKSNSFSHRFQIIAEAASTEGSVLAEAQWVEMDNQGKGLPKGYWSEVLFQADYRQQCAISDVMLVQQLSTNSNVDPTNNSAPIQYTEGFLPWALAGSNSVSTIPVGGVGGLTVDNFITTAKYIKKQYTSKHTYAKLGVNRSAEVSTVLFEYFQNANIVAASLESAADLPGYSGLSGVIQFERFVFMNNVFHFSEWNELTDPQTYNYTGSKYPDFAAFFPMGQTRDAQTQKMSPIIGYRWKEGHGYSRHLEVWPVGASGGQSNFQYTGELDTLKMNYRSEIATEYKLVNQVALWKS